MTHIHIYDILRDISGKERCMTRLPNVIFVRLEDPGKYGYLEADDVPNGSEGDSIGEYHLIATGTVHLEAPTMEGRKLCRRVTR